MYIHTGLPLAVLLVVFSPAAGDAVPLDRLDADRLCVQSFGPLTNGQSEVGVSAPVGIGGALSVNGTVAFPQGIAYLAPAPGLTMGPFTNVGWTAEGTPCPEWWRTHGVINEDAAPNDFAAVTQGQVKWLVHAAALSLAEIDYVVYSWDGMEHAPAIAALVGSFSPSNNALPVTLGQLKAAVRPFWNLVGLWDMVGGPPTWFYDGDDVIWWREWMDDISGDSALVNVGQAKTVFSFDLPTWGVSIDDTDGDGVRDGHEMFLYGTDNQRWDSDGDGISDGEEIARGLSPLKCDTDDDGLGDAEELAAETDPLNPDTDNDGLPDGWEVQYGLNPKDSGGMFGASGDPDLDDLTNEEEYARGTDPMRNDTDNNGLPDGWEVQYGLNPKDPDGMSGASGDPDLDGLTNEEEYALGTNPMMFDTDYDGLFDGEEVGFGTNPLLADSDSDGISDADELYLYNTDPCLADTDADGLGDAEELAVETDPLNPDTDSDGLSDGDEIELGTNPLSADSDSDGISDGEEILLHGTDPRLADTDGDGLGDAEELAVGTDPLNPDTDSDGLSDGDEVGAGTNPFLADSDFDGVGDGDEVHLYGTAPLLTDTDGDGILDGEELTHVPPLSPVSADSDGDGYPDGEETLSGSNPLLPDDGAGTSVRYYYDEDDRLTTVCAGTMQATSVTVLSPSGNPTRETSR